MPRYADHRLIWFVDDQIYQVISHHTQTAIVPDSQEWFDWLNSVASFAFQGRNGHYTARKERKKRGETYWYAYLGTGKKLTKKYLGKTENVTVTRLEQAAEELRTAQKTAVNISHEASFDLSTLTKHDQASAYIQPSEQRSNLLLLTKLHVPRPRVKLVPRSHLSLRLQQGLACPLTLVSAPAGFGKTTLLAQWLAESTLSVAWLSLDRKDNDPIRFLSYLIAALQSVHPQIGSSLMPLLHSPQPTSLEHLLALLVNDLATSEEQDIALVLDDYHVIITEPVHQIIAFLLEHMPANTHLIITTRVDPPLPLPGLRVRRQLIEVRTADLRFSVQETDAFLQDVMGLELRPHEIELLEQRTEGWIAGLQLAALSLQGRVNPSDFFASFTGSHRLILDYLSEEVFSRQSAPVQSFLLQTAILERLSGPLCDAVTEQQGSQAMLETLERRNLFMVPLDEKRHWYRYHHLFAEVLKNRLALSNPALVPELHRRASHWYEQHDLPIEAIQHALAAHDLENAARLIEQNAILMHAQGQTSLLSDWFNMLPESLIRTRPLLCIYHASLHHFLQQFPEAEARLQDAERSITTDTPAELTNYVSGLTAIIQANIARYSGDFVRYQAIASPALDLLPENATMARASVLMQQAHSYLLTGDVSASTEQHVKAAIAYIRTTGYLSVHIRSLINLAQLHIYQGRLREAATIYEEAGRVTPGQELLRMVMAGPAYCFALGDLLVEWNSLDEAERLLVQGMDLLKGPLMVFADDMLRGYRALARLQQARGKYHQACSTLDAFMDLVEERGFAPWLKVAGAMTRVQLELAQDHLTNALHHARIINPESIELPFLRERAYLILARVKIAQSRHNSAGSQLQETLSLLDHLLQEATTHARMGSALEIFILQALALHVTNDLPNALTALERAIALARPQGYIRLFVDEGKPMLILLRKALAHGLSPAYITTLLAAFDPQHASDATSITASTLIEPLTQRERVVLALLLEGATNREIANRLIVSVNTVKKHIFNICGKLGVQSRIQAMVKARELHLV